jgi:hypothetical protein
VTSYVQGGNERLAVYRDQSRPTFVAQEFRSMIDKMPELTLYLPEMRRYRHPHGPDGAIVASKMLYASHDFWTGLELRVLLPGST